MTDNTSKRIVEYAIEGDYLSNALALALSYYLNHSTWWALLHSLFGSYYIIYAVLTGQVFK